MRDTVIFAMSSTMSVGRQLVEPLGVERISVFARSRILKACSGTSSPSLAHLFAREARAQLVLARRVADHRGEVADEEDDRVPELLELPHLRHQDGVAEVEVGARRIEAGLHAQRLAGAPRRFFELGATWRSTTPRVRTPSARGVMAAG